jgi:hypothetical protein
MIRIWCRVRGWWRTLALGLATVSTGTLTPSHGKHASGPANLVWSTPPSGAQSRRKTTRTIPTSTQPSAESCRDYLRARHPDLGGNDLASRGSQRWRSRSLIIRATKRASGIAIRTQTRIPTPIIAVVLIRTPG